MKHTTTTVAMAPPCHYQTKKRPMSRGPQSLKPILKTYLILTLFFWGLGNCGAFAQAQTNPNKEQNNPTPYTLKGRITDTQNSPLPGATITDTQSQTTAQSDQNGNFALPTNTPNGTVKITYLGYQSQTLHYSSEKPLTVSLHEDPSTLRTVEINAGYYSTSQKRATGSISSIKAGDIEKQPVANPLQALQGRITGAYIQQSSGTPGGNVNLIIRGQSSIESSAIPLYIVDGVPYNASPQFSNLTATVSIYSSGGPSPLAVIPPEEIQSIDILKDADATAIYGTRGANGVVLITTKKHHSGSPTLQFSTQTGISQAPQRIQMLSTSDYLALRQKAIELDNTTIKATDYDLNGTWDPNAQTDWQDELFGGTASFSSTRIALGGGTQNHSFSASASRNDQGSVYQGDNRYSRTSVHLGSSHATTDQKFKASFSILYSTDKTNWLNGDFISRAASLSPNAPTLRSPDGSLNWAASSWINPLRSLENTYRSTNTNLNASSQLSYQPLKDLQLSATLGYGAQSLDNRAMLPVSYYDPAEGRTPSTSMLDLGASQLSNWTIEPQANFQKTFGPHQFAALLGGSLQQQLRDQQLLRGTGFASDALIENLAAASTITVRGTSESRYRYSGIFTRLNYSYSGKYILNLTARRDASSRFGPGRTSANFGAIGLAYLLSEENFLKQHFSFLSFAKLRASYGLTGNDQIGDYEYLDTYQSGLGYNGIAALSPLRLFNADFGWEKNGKFELGLDFGFFADQLTGTIGYYRNRSSSQLVDYPLAMTAGFSSIRANLDARIQHTGLEMEFALRPKTSGKLRYHLSANLTLPDSRLLRFPNLAASGYANSYVIGQPLSIQKLYQLKGVNPQTGLYEFIDQNGDGVINTADRTLVRRRGQRAYGGIGTSLSYGGLELDILIQVVAQRQSTFANQYTTALGRLANQPQAYLGKYWSAPGDLAELQRPSTATNSAATTAQNNYTQSEAANGDASFARLKNVSLSYRTTKLIPGKSVKLGLQGQNLYTLTRYFGLDPESAGLSLPPLRTITFSLNLNF